MCAKPRSVPEDPFVQLNLFNPVASDSKIAISIAACHALQVIFISLVTNLL